MPRQTLLVVAFDFGTTFSGWAFAFKADFEKDPTQVHARKYVTGNHMSLKTPTCVLLEPDGHTFHAFGYEAENKYSDLAVDNKHQKWYFFKSLKMILYDTMDLRRDVSLKDETGKELSAMTIFIHAIQYLKNDVLDALKKINGPGLKLQEIQWVITVPAIWSDGAKQFMREAAISAGIPSEQLLLALEAEAASIFCRQCLPSGKMEGDDGMKDLKFGTKFMVLDAGGGTVDITVHQVLPPNGDLKELEKASGGAWGGTRVDKEFMEFLFEIAGRKKSVLDKFHTQYTYDYLELCKTFEIKKRMVKRECEEKVTIRLPVCLTDIIKTETGKDLGECVERSRFSKFIMVHDNKIRVDAAVIKKLFEPSIKSIVDHVERLLQTKTTQGLTAILMVGGFSDCDLLQKAIRDKFPTIKLIVPKDAGLVVIKGAVAFGFNPNSITMRICKYTYGVAGSREFTNGLHTFRLQRKTKAGLMCVKIFDKHVEAGQAVTINVPQNERCYIPASTEQEEMLLDFYASEDTSPKYTEDCRHLGTLTMKLSNDHKIPPESRGVKVSLMFSGTEITVRAVEMSTGKLTTAKLDFLG